MKKQIAVLAAFMMAVSVGLSSCGSDNDSSSSKASTTSAAASSEAESESQSESSESSEESSEQNSDAIEISSADDFKKIYDDLTANYVLTGDIDFAGESIDPVGIFEPKSEAEEDSETPNDEKAFSGTFDGNGYTISNVKIDAADKNGVGIFGCVSGTGAGVKNLKVENIDVTGSAMTGGVIGYAYYDTNVQDITMSGENTVNGTFLIGGVVGASHADIENCTAAATVNLTNENAQGAGIIVGGLEDGSISNCSVSGKVTAKDGCYSIGGLAGCFHNSKYAKDCTAENVEIETGDKCWLVGGLAGHSGTFEGDPTSVENGKVSNVSIKTGENSERIGGIVGGGFYGSAYKQYYAEPSKSNLKSCSVSDFTVTGGKYVGAAVGYAYNSTTVEAFNGTVKWNDKESDEQIGADEKISLDKLL